MAKHPEYSEFCPHCGFKIASTHHYFVVKHNTRLSQQQCFSQNSSALSGSHSPTCSRSLPSPAPPPRSPTRSPFASQTVFRVKAVCALGHWVSVEHPGSAEPVHAPAQAQHPPGGGISSPLHLTSRSHLPISCPSSVSSRSSAVAVTENLLRSACSFRVGGLLLLALCPHQHRHHSTFSPYLNQILAASRLCLWGPPLIFQHNNIINFNFLSRPGGLLQCNLSSPVLDYCLHATIFCLLYQYYRHFIFSLAQAPWNDSTYSFELALNVWLTYSTRSRHRTSVSGDGSTATVVHERWLIMAHLNYFASN